VRDVFVNERDVREGGSWSALQRTKNTAIWLLASAVLAASRPLPPAVLRALGRTLGKVAHGVARGARRIAMRNVALALPELDDRERARLVARCFETLGEWLGETVAMLRPHALPPLPISSDALRTLDEARAGGRGVVFLSAHLGPWERVAASLVAAGVPLVTVARESYDPRLSRLYDRLRSTHGVDVIWRSRPGASTGLLRALRSGRVLGMPMDLRSRVPSCDVPFLGHSAPTAVGPARIALRTGSPVVVGTVGPDPRPRNGPLTITATRIDTSDLKADPAGAVELTARINLELSRRILALPYAWVWMHERWPAAKRGIMGSGGILPWRTSRSRPSPELPATR
jgi:KDO2-lipid IV(A) lauroyltransferase